MGGKFGWKVQLGDKLYVETSIRELISSKPDLEITTMKDRAAIYKSSLDSQKSPSIFLLYLLVHLVLLIY